MKEFSYVVKDELGIHARPARMLVKEAKTFDSKITITKNGKEVEASKLMALMALGVKKSDTIVVKATGDDEETAIGALEKLLEENL